MVARALASTGFTLKLRLIFLQLRLSLLLLVVPYHGFVPRAAQGAVLGLRRRWL
jgi:hypothetical protein